MNQQQATLIGFGITALCVIWGFYGIQRQVAKASDDTQKTLKELPQEWLKQVRL